MKIIDERDMLKTNEKKQKQNKTKKQTKTEKNKGTEAIVKGRELNDFAVHLS